MRIVFGIIFVIVTVIGIYFMLRYQETLEELEKERSIKNKQNLNDRQKILKIIDLLEMYNRGYSPYQILREIEHTIKKDISTRQSN